MTPSLVGAGFALRRRNKPFYDYFEALWRTMPEDAPGSLIGEAYAELVAVLLARNNVPAGDQELTDDPDALHSRREATVIYNNLPQILAAGRDRSVKAAAR